MAVSPLVSICCITYEHAAFIRQAIEGFLAQRTDFPFEIIVHDDASTDGTADIVRAYEREHPDLIRGIYQTENQFRLETGRVTRTIRAAARGEFIATCDGDDYWIDTEKLQVQVDHLRSHTEQSFCFTNAWDDHPSGKRADYVRSWLGTDRPATVYELKDIIAANFVPTAGVLYRRACSSRIPEALVTATAMDWFLYVELAKQGSFGYLDRMSAVHRLHPGGVISMKDRFTMIDNNLRLLEKIDEMTGRRFSDTVLQRRGELDRMAISHAVNTGAPGKGAKYLRDLLKHPQLRNATGTRELLRSSVLIHTPAIARIIHKLRGSRS